MNRLIESRIAETDIVEPFQNWNSPYFRSLNTAPWEQNHERTHERSTSKGNRNGPPFLIVHVEKPR
jgi:hypothetical protein